MLFRSLQARLAITVGLSITLLWLAAAGLTASRMGRDFEQVYDDGLRSTAERLLSIVRHELRKGRSDHDGGLSREHDGEEGDEQDEPHDKRPDVRYGENVAFLVRNMNGSVLLASPGARPEDFPPYQSNGFGQTATHRLYYAANADRRLTVTVAEPLDQRKALSRKMLFGLLSPLIVVIPLSLIILLFMVRRSLDPVRALQQGLKDRGAQDLSPLPDAGLPEELLPISAGVNQLLSRLRKAFQAERALAANAAHELRTPVAGAIAQAQRIRAETAEAQTAGRAIEIETTLKRLMRMSEKLMQLARAEGGRLTTDEPTDLRPLVRMIADDFARAGEDRIEVVVADVPVLSNLDPDALGIVLRNLIENALRHGEEHKPVHVSLSADRILSVANDGDPLPSDTVKRVMDRFERASSRLSGSGLGLSIIQLICERIGAKLEIVSPRTGSGRGVEVDIALPQVPS